MELLKLEIERKRKELEDANLMVSKWKTKAIVVIELYAISDINCLALRKK